MRRKEERSKQGQTNNKAKQHSTPKAVTFPKKNELPRVGLEPTTLYIMWLCIHAVVCVALCFQGDGSASELPPDQRTTDKGRLTAAQEGEEVFYQSCSNGVFVVLCVSHRPGSRIWWCLCTSQRLRMSMKELPSSTLAAGQSNCLLLIIASDDLWSPYNVPCQVLRRSHSNTGLLVPVPVHHASSQPVLHYSPHQERGQREVWHHCSHSLCMGRIRHYIISCGYLHTTDSLQTSTSALHRETTLWRAQWEKGYCQKYWKAFWVPERS